MKKYIKFIQIAFKDRLAYRTEYFLGVLGFVFILMAQLFLWRATLGRTQQTLTTAGVVTMKEMTTYVFVAIVIGILIRNSLIQNMSDRIRNGLIISDLIKPMNFKGYLFSDMVGRSLFNFIFQLLPVLALGLIFLRIEYPSPLNLLLFCFALAGAMIVMFLLSFCLGLLAFWYSSMWQLNTLMWGFISVFSGMYIPLWFFPKTLADIANVLPFRLMYFVPTTIFLGQAGLADCLYMLLQQFIWILGLYLLSILMWRTAIKKLVIQGG
jgi:ABC-2 type transport system permease protein